MIILIIFIGQILINKKKKKINFSKKIEMKDNYSQRFHNVIPGEAHTY